MSLDSRVGMASLSVIRDLLKDYITAFTVQGKYVGDVQYLIKYQGLNKILEGEHDGKNINN